MRTQKELRELRPEDYHLITQEDLGAYPHMVRWFNPRLLTKLLLQVIVSKLFGQYADRRLIHAALDNAPDKEFLDRADVVSNMGEDDEGAIWIDFVSDLGDGFDATYAIASLIGRDRLEVPGCATPLPRGSALIMGGDEVYPLASRWNYILRMRHPYSFAYPDPDPNQKKKRPLVFAVSGNHDWYDGLDVFLALFCRTKATPLGNWRTSQRRSYFAFQVRPDWWIWGIDIALTENMDQPQADYFHLIAEKMPDHARLILCTAAPGWYDEKAESYRCLGYAAWIAENAKKDIKIVCLLSGDTHHYARYTSTFGTQFITSGGGGAYLSGTHDLKKELPVTWLRQGQVHLKLGSKTSAQPGAALEDACYPSKCTSYRNLWRNLQFSFLNWDFSLFLGFVFWLMGYALLLRPELDTLILTFLILWAGFGAYNYYHDGLKGAVVAVFNAGAQWYALTKLTEWFAQFNAGILSDLPPSWGWFGLFGVEMVSAGGLVSGTIFGLYLALSCSVFGINNNDAFSAIRRNSHRHFLRMRIAGDLTIYPIKLDRIPRRKEWRKNTAPNAHPLFTAELTPELIEDPIVIDPQTVKSVREIESESATYRLP